MKEFAVAITTYNRPDVLEFTLSQFKKFGGGDLLIVNDCSSVPYPKLANCFTSKERLGIAKSKNKCLSILDKDYERIFLFDDDCFPIKKNWWQPYIDGGMHHYCYGCEPKNTVLKHVDNISVWNDTYGCCLMVDQEVLRTVGGMDNRFGLWGYEHAEYTHRIFNAGLTPYQYITPRDVAKYIWSFDMLGSYGGFEWKYKSSIPKQEQDAWHVKNLSLFQSCLKNTNFCSYD